MTLNELANKFGLDIDALSELHHELSAFTEVKNHSEFRGDLRSLIVELKKLLQRFGNKYPKLYSLAFSVSSESVKYSDDIVSLIEVMEGKLLRAQSATSPTKIKGVKSSSELSKHHDIEFNRHSINLKKQLGEVLYKKMRDSNRSGWLNRIQKTVKGTHKSTLITQTFGLKTGFDIRQKQTIELLGLAAFWVSEKGKITTSESHDFYRFAALYLNNDEHLAVTIADRFRSNIEVSTHSGGLGGIYLMSYP